MLGDASTVGMTCASQLGKSSVYTADSHVCKQCHNLHSLSVMQLTAFKVITKNKQMGVIKTDQQFDFNAPASYDQASSIDSHLTSVSASSSSSSDDSSSSSSASSSSSSGSGASSSSSSNDASSSSSSNEGSYSGIISSLDSSSGGSSPSGDNSVSCTSDKLNPLCLTKVLKQIWHKCVAFAKPVCHL